MAFARLKRGRSVAKGAIAQPLTIDKQDDNYSVNVRRIENGYIVSQSSDSKYQETYSATRPNIGPAPTSIDGAAGDTPSSLAKAIAAIPKE